MKTITLSATQARNQFFPLLDKIAKEGLRVVVEKKDTKSRVEMVTGEMRIKARLKAVKDTYGMLRRAKDSDFYDSSRVSRNKESLRNLRQSK